MTKNSLPATAAKVTLSFERVPCPRCGYRGSNSVIAGRDRLHNIGGLYYVAQCRKCRLWFQNPRPPAAEFQRLYPADYKPYATPGSQTEQFGKAELRYLKNHLNYEHLTIDPLTIRERLFSHLRRRIGYTMAIELIPAFVPGGRLLEIGCASGARLRTYRALGWERLYGIDVSPRAAAIAQANGFSVQCGAAEEIIESYEDESFDVIVASMVVEHLLNPFEMMELVSRKLKPRGEFLFSTVQRTSVDFVIYRTYWYNLDLPRHTVFLQKEDICAMLARHFTQVEMFHQVAPMDFVGSATFRLRERQSIIDKTIVALGESRVKYFSLILAWLGLTSRVSIKCKKKLKG